MPDLCDSCQYCQKVVGFGREIKDCGVFTRTPDFPVESCTRWEAKTAISLYEMKQIAIYIEKKKDAPGFSFTKKKPSDYEDLP